MRDRYVLQVLLATLGCGLLLGAVAIIDTPKDWTQPARDTIAKPIEAASRPADFKDECNLPFGLTAEETERLAKQDCEKADSTLRGFRSE